MKAESHGRAADAAHFAPRFESLAPLMAFVVEVSARLELPPGTLPSLQLVIEELFTNMVKYGGARHDPVEIEITRCPGGVEVALTDHDVAPFALTQAPPVDTSRPLQEREPGGLGLHLTRHLVDHLRYDYDAQRREARIVFRKLHPRSVQP